MINFFDHKITNKYEAISKLQGDSVNEKIKHFWSLFYVKMQQQNVQRCIWSDFIDKTYQDLQDLVRCLEIYLDDCVGKMPILCYSPDIKALNIHSVLNFNYTAIPIGLYSLPEENTHYIHGRALANRPAVENNMVLGVNEYWEGTDKNTHTNFNLYKKFVQRIIKETGIDYKKALRTMLSGYKSAEHLHITAKGYPKPKPNNVYIFGHSLDVTDGDILREVIQTEGVDTTIFYKDKQQQANQIANLSKVLGQEKLLEYTFSTDPAIVFKRQAEMAPI